MNKFLILIPAVFFVIGCTEIGEPTMHPNDWLDPNSSSSHMEKIAERGIEGCQVCHGGTEKHDYFGGQSGVSCYECHAGGPSGHPAFNIWVGSPNNENFHGKQDTNQCRTCHGRNSDGGIANVSCFICHETF